MFSVNLMIESDTKNAWNLEVFIGNTDIPRATKIEELELIGAACLLKCTSNSQEKKARLRRGVFYWKSAHILRSIQPTIDKFPSILSDRAREATNFVTELTTMAQVKKMAQQSPWVVKTQALLFCNRILSLHNSFPNPFVMVNFDHYSMEDWEVKLSRDRNRSLTTNNHALRNALYIIELYNEEWCDSVWQPDSSDSISMMTWATIHNILIDLYDILRHPLTLPSDLRLPDLLMAFVFTSKHLVKIRAKYFPLEHQTQFETRENLISHMGSLIVQLMYIILTFTPEYGPIELGILENWKKFHECLSLHVALYKKWEKDNPMLLQRACEIVLVDDRMFQVILVLIGARVDANIVDENGRGPLHWLVNEEMSLFPRNELRNWNLDHGSRFTEAIIALVIAGCHQDKTDNNGETAWNQFKLLEDVMV
jgi:hypothetical protein